MKRVTEEVQLLTCHGCGNPTKGRQWHNMKRGKSLCNLCIPICHRNMDDKTFRAFYGVDGVNYNITEPKGKDDETKNDS